MKIELTKEDKEALDNMIKHNHVRAYLKAKENMKFEIGDVILKYHYSRYSDKPGWEAEKLHNSDNSKMPQRYVYIHEDDCGIGYFKKLKVSDGTLGVELFCMTDEVSEDVKFEVDPEYAEHNLLGVDFNIKDLHKQSLEQQKIVTKMNRKNGIKPQKLSEANAFFANMKKGDVFYESHNFTGKYYYKKTFTKLVKVMIKDIKSDDWNWNYYSRDSKDYIDDDHFYEVHYTTDYGSDDARSYRYSKGSYVLFNREPASTKGQ